ncbi:MAG: sodium:solute symporter [candidate division KSB1 bacterium]|nr:sodium:solute symporter [candidate division KSB1 bacterium]MDZ7300538.1 sodium:solute symporter [candidate division KSB1 bacterium]MDZ7309677.1 sodium:solute symporter [candidate division KSB1 bacterium]
MSNLFWDVGIIILYFITIISLGLYMGRREESMEDFALGGRKIPWWAVLASIIAAETSAATFLGIPAEGYRLQSALYVQLMVGTILARIIIAFLFIKPYYKYQVYTVYEFLQKRFGEISRIAGSVIFLVTRVLASGVRIYIAAVVLVVAWKFLTGESPTLEQYVVAISIMTLLTTVYTMMGGIKAVIWTDLIQACVMFGGALASLVIIVHLIPGGWEGIKAGTNNFANLKIFSTGLQNERTLYEAMLSIFRQEYTIWAALTGYIFLVMATHGTDQDMVQRMLTATDYKRSRLSLIMSGVADVPIALAFVTIGIFLYAYFQRVPDSSLPQAHNEIFAYFIINKMPVGLRGLIIAGVFATAMGSLSAALNALATSFVKDFYTPYIKKNAGEKHYVFAARVFTFVFAILMIIVASLAAYSVLHNPKLTIIPIALGIIGYTYGSLLGMFLIGMLTRTRGNDRGNLIAMVCGFLTVLVLSGTANTLLGWFGLPQLEVPQIAFTWYIMFGCIVTFLVGIMFRTKGSPAAPVG